MIILLVKIWERIWKGRFIGRNTIGRTCWVWIQSLLEFHRVPRLGRTKAEVGAGVVWAPSFFLRAHRTWEMPRPATGWHCALTLLSLGVLHGLSTPEHTMSSFTTLIEGRDPPVQTFSIQDQSPHNHKTEFWFWTAQKGLEEMSDLEFGFSSQTVLRSRDLATTDLSVKSDWLFYRPRPAGQDWKSLGFHSWFRLHSKTAAGSFLRKKKETKKCKTWFNDQFMSKH